HSRPAELVLVQTLGEQAKPGPIPPHDLHPVGPLGPEDVERAGERIGAGVAHQCRQAVRAFPEVDRARCHIDLGSRWDHADRNARIASTRRLDDILATTRMVASPMTISRRPTRSSSPCATSTVAKLCASASGRSGNIAMAPERIALRRHANTCCGLTSCARATAETFAPGVIASSSIRAFASSDQRRRGTAGLASRRFGTASMTANVPCLDLGAECKQTSRENHHESVAAFINPQNTGSAWRLHMSDGSGSILLLWNNLLLI